MSAPVLAVQDLRVSIGTAEIVRGVSFAVEPGQTLGIVGESGSGKSMTVLAATGLLDAPGAVVTGSSVLAPAPGAAGSPAVAGAGAGTTGTQLVGASARTLRRVHGDRVGFVFQDPSTSLNPVLPLGRQIGESLEAHRGMTPRQARTRALELLEAVGIPEPAARLDAYPHQLSGGQRQRVMIAVALACDPALLIADEPTTALDVTTQAQIVALVQALQHDRGTAVVWISHDLGLIGQVADDVTVLRAGEQVESRPVLDLVDRPQHAYTRELLAARPLLGQSHPAPAYPAAAPLLTVEGLDVRFPVVTPTGRTHVHAVDDVSFTVRRGHTLGVVGESGSGKSTIAHVLTGLVAPRAGRVDLDGVDVLGQRGAALKALRRRIAMVFQDPFSSLNGRSTVGTSIAEPLQVHGLARGRDGVRRRVGELLELVDLPAGWADRYPHELSGGQRQRVSIARALALEPELVVLDESTASLDVSIQARVLELLARLQAELGLTYLFIAHDLAVVERVSHDVLVLQRGRVVEQGPARQLFADPREPYTRALLAAIPPVRPRGAPEPA
ncbi:dipeptide ABC transporter ATP-binding protein [Cellulomonas marina]|uniref:Peptide/nickel transport system ATP-binding protein n=1 Tax=Cellulomonas marina TaxID=988821 RepID=A0A1I0Y4Q4_9CELL|nr:ABC transporter ATP-binding protein [Cellulomonas marina]GIG29800.1 ABC transporter ATP-binding protein [Cellulomonas marina]SFB08385.1 peptide/nickel transport system ATP-binding protein [Cellulomonas marina]